MILRSELNPEQELKYLDMALDMERQYREKRYYPPNYSNCDRCMYRDYCAKHTDDPSSLLREIVDDRFAVLDGKITTEEALN